MILALVGLWYLWTLFSEDRDAREQTRRESEQERLELEKERLELEKRRASEDKEWRLEQRHELEQLRIERDLERAGGVALEERLALVESWKRTNRRQAREREALRPDPVESWKRSNERQASERQAGSREAFLGRANNLHVCRSALEDEEDDGGWPGYAA